MNKKGFTLVELLAVIAVVAILAVMVTPAIIGLKNSVLESTYESKVAQIENAAKDYAEAHLDLLPRFVCDGVSTNNGCTTDLNEIITKEELDSNTYERKYYKACAWITINGLLDDGYLKSTNTYVVDESGKKETQIINPITNESMNNEMICMRYNNNDAMTREIITFILNDTTLEDFHEN